MRDARQDLRIGLADKTSILRLNHVRSSSCRRTKFEAQLTPTCPPASRERRSPFAISSTPLIPQVLCSLGLPTMDDFWSMLNKPGINIMWDNVNVAGSERACT
jgi:hypothetical protein